jgi:hypothetical protein
MCVTVGGVFSCCIDLISLYETKLSVPKDEFYWA